MTLIDMLKQSNTC